MTDYSWIPTWGCFFILVWMTFAPKRLRYNLWEKGRIGLRTFWNKRNKIKRWWNARK